MTAPVPAPLRQKEEQTIVKPSLTEDGYVFETDNGSRAGPYNAAGLASIDFDAKVAGVLHVEAGDVFRARLNMPEFLPRLKLRDIDASKISWKQEYLLEGQIVGESDKKAVPKSVRIYCPGCRADETITLTSELQAALLFQGSSGLQKKLSDHLQDPNPSREGGSCHHVRAVILQELDYADYRLLSLRTPPTADEELDPTDFRSVKAYAIGHLIPQSKMVRVRARVLVESKKQDIVLVVTETKPLEDEITSFKLTDQDKKDFTRYFSDKDPLEEVDGYFIPKLVGQTLRKQLMLLVLHSPPWIRLPDGSRIRGLLRLLIIGDTKTFKSKGLRWVTDSLGVGEMCYAETSSRTGLLYNIDADNRILFWGILPRNDLGLCLIAGFHHISPDEMVQFREVFEFLRIKVTRLVEAEAHCRTRVIADSNPRRASMKEYVLPCEAIADLPFFRGTPDMTRWDLYITVKHGDVNQEDIDKSEESPLTIPSSVQRRHILWAMSRRTENIKFTDGTLDRVNEVNGRIVQEYGSETLPIVHPGFKEVVIRIASSVAATLHSTDETHDNVIVRPEHVDATDSYLRALFNQNLELDRYAAEEKSKTLLTDSDLQQIIGQLDETDLSMLREMRRGSMQSSVLAERLTLDDSTIRKHAATLKARELVKASRGRAGGYELAPKGIRVIQKLMPAKPPATAGGPPANVNPLENVTYSAQYVTKTPQFTEYKGTPPVDVYELVLQEATRLTKEKGAAKRSDLEAALKDKATPEQIDAWMKRLVKEGLAVDGRDWGEWRTVR